MRRHVAFVFKFVLFLIVAVIGSVQITFPPPGYAAGRSKTPGVALSPAASAALHYAEAVSSGDRAAVGRLDFGCLYRLVSGGKPVRTLPPPDSSHVSFSSTADPCTSSFIVVASFPPSQWLDDFTSCSPPINRILFVLSLPSVVSTTRAVPLGVIHTR